MSCRASGDNDENVRITYEWYKNNVLIQSNEDVTADEEDLVLNKAIPADAAEYHCEVSNYDDAPSDKSKTARIEVYSKLETKLKYGSPFYSG